MVQQGQAFPLAGQGRDGTRWAYWYRVGGRDSRRVQRGGFASQQASRTRSAGTRRSGRSSRGKSWTRAPAGSVPATARAWEPVSR
jgi:hypothetical protein